MKQVVAYYRASKTEQLNSIEVQRNQMRDFIKKYGDNYKLVAEYSEYHTGKDRKRIELAKAIKEITEIPIYLIVTHGIFSAGFKTLFEYFEGIYCTNSIDDIHETSFAGEKVKQLNIF